MFFWFRTNKWCRNRNRLSRLKIEIRKDSSGLTWVFVCFNLNWDREKTFKVKKLRPTAVQQCSSAAALQCSSASGPSRVATGDEERTHFPSEAGAFNISPQWSNTAAIKGAFCVEIVQVNHRTTLTTLILPRKLFQVKFACDNQWTGKVL